MIVITIKRNYFMETNRINPIDDVRVQLNFDGREKDAFQGSGFHSIEEAIRNAFDATDVGHLNIEDYVFVVTNMSTGTSGRYRINAGGHVTLLPE